MKNLLALSCLLLLVVSGTGTARACSCLPPPPPLEALEAASAVFSGRVVAVETREGAGGWRNVRVVLRVQQVWKGDVTASVVVYTPENSASCGYGFEQGRSYLVYAYTQEEQLHTNLCTRTAPLEAAQEDLTALGQGEAPRSPGGLCGGCNSLPVTQALFFVLVGLAWMRRR